MMTRGSSSQETDVSPRAERGWREKFAAAWRGLRLVALGESSFRVHLLATVLVAAVGGLLGLTWQQWSLVGLCIALVMVAETLNTAIERLARAVTTSEHPQIRDALDLASGAVLLAALAAVGVGLLVFLPRLWQLFA